MAAHHAPTPTKHAPAKAAAPAKHAAPAAGKAAAPQASAAKAGVKQMGYAAGAAHLAPGGAADKKHAPGQEDAAPMAMAARKKSTDASLSPAESNAAVRYNRARGFTVAQVKKFQRIVGTAADGDFGPDTVKHIALFQAGHGLEVDGKIGPATQAKLNAAGAQNTDSKQDDKKPAHGGQPAPHGGGGGAKVAKLTHADIVEAVHYNKEKGFSVAQVKKIQSKTGAGVDGYFGPDTVKHIANYQLRHGLEVDGKVGPATAKSLGVELASGGGQGSNHQKLVWAENKARSMGLYITSTTGGKHTPGSFHYRGRAFDAAGTPKNMANFFWAILKTHPTELFYDPCGAYDNGHYSEKGIGKHNDHVHVAY